jgi:hypothetical protein
MNDLADLKNRIAVIGVGNTKYGSFPEIDDYGLAVHAFRNAVADCGIDKNRIDGLPVSSTPSQRPRSTSNSSCSPNAGTIRGSASAASASAFRYFSPTQWNQWLPNSLRSAGTPMMGLRARTLIILNTGPTGWAAGPHRFNHTGGTDVATPMGK